MIGISYKGNVLFIREGACRPLCAQEVVIIPLDREFDFRCVNDFKLEIQKALQSPSTKVILDFADVVYIDSAGIGAILSLHRSLVHLGGELSFIKVSDKIMRIFSRTRLLDLIHIRGSVSTTSSSVTPIPKNKVPIIYLTFKVPETPNSMEKARDDIRQELKKLNFTSEAAFDFILAFGEALGNAFCHGTSKGGKTTVYVTFAGYDDRAVVEVSDLGCGCKYVDGTLPIPSETRGRGIRLMHLLADAVQIQKSERGVGTKVTLVKMRD